MIPGILVGLGLFGLIYGIFIKESIVLIRQENKISWKEKVYALLGYEQIRQKLERIDSSLDPKFVITIRVGAVCLFALIFFRLFGIVGGVTGALTGWLSVNLWISYITNTYIKRIESRVPEVADLVAIMMKSGIGTINEALIKVLDEKYIFDRVILDAMRKTDTIENALKVAADKCISPEAESFLNTLSQSHTFGGAVADILKHQAIGIHRMHVNALKERQGKNVIVILIISILFMFLPYVVLVMRPAVEILSLLFS